MVATDITGLKVTRLVEISVTAPNRPPGLSAPDEVTLDEGTVISIPLTGDDPDGDALTYHAAPLPANAALLKVAGDITFAPDYEQSGTYDITCRVHDGSLWSTDRVVRVMVNDVLLGMDTNALVLDVDPVESPSLHDRVQVTGRVNADTNPPPRQPVSFSLITGLAPGNLRRGETADVTLTGKGSGLFATHFEAGVSQADFGEGVTVDALSVAGDTQAVATVSVAEDASVGLRSVNVRTGAETAYAVPAFRVEEGQPTTNISSSRKTTPPSPTCFTSAGPTRASSGTRIPRTRPSGRWNS